MNTHHNLLLFAITSSLLLLGHIPNTLQAEPLTGNCLEKKKMLVPCSNVFSIHDIDKSGSLNKEEYQHFVEQIENRRKSTGRPMRRFLPTLRFEEIDKNNDQYINEDEMTSALNKRLKKHRRYRYKNKQ